MIWTSYTDRPRRRHLGLALLAASLLVALLAPGAPALASETGPLLHAPAAPAAQESGQRGEPEANLPYLFAVYIITWLAFFGYVFFMSRRQRDMQREIDELKRAISESESRGNTWG